MIKMAAIGKGFPTLTNRRGKGMRAADDVKIKATGKQNGKMTIFTLNVDTFQLFA